MTFQDYYVRECKWCQKRLVMGLCNDDAWRAYEIPSTEQREWVFHRCPNRGIQANVSQSLRRLLFDF